jgi:DNA-binding SARP family transcriptional activator
MRFLILGPIEVWSDTSAVPLTAPKALTLLTLLLLEHDEVIPAEKIGEMLWPQKKGMEQSTALRFHVWKLRGVLEPDRPQRSPGEVIRKKGPGYTLALSGHTFDLSEFEWLLQRARECLVQEPAEALGHVQQGLALWRGEPLSDVRYENFAQGAIRRLTAMRLDAEILRVDSLLAMGRHREAIVDLEELTITHPLVERLWAQLMIALYFAGRQGEAHLVYQRACRTMADEFGVAPSASLQSLDSDIKRRRRGN